jgi:hypothetical protein
MTRDAADKIILILTKIRDEVVEIQEQTGVSKDTWAEYALREHALNMAIIAVDKEGKRRD